MARVIEITTPLEKDVLLLHKMQATEEMSRLFKYELELFSLKEDVPLDEVLGKSITVTLERADGEVRYFNGICSRISEGGKRGRFFTYHATVRPWLWLLTRTKNYRIFQEKSVPDILKEIFDQHAGIANVEVQLTETYTPWVYCVQYNETDFAFVSRLMEHEGIYYYFKHIDGKHTLVIADSYSAHSPCYESEIPFIPPHERVRPEREHVSEWSITREIRPGKYALASYDFEKPSVDLQVRSSIKREHAEAEYEVFEYGGDYVERSDGEMYARTRIEEVQAKHERTRGATNARALAPGYLFKLDQHPRSDQNAEYLVVSAEYAIQSGEHEAIDAAAAEYACTFTALNCRQPFRAERATPKPVVQGPQTALVVGPSGEDIYTDKYGRIKVHFYWDRKSNRDDNSSCWIRVSQNWGGKGWGGMFIPHVGQEVIVMFEGGDPDLPLITGRVYNAENMPPLELPANKSKSVIRDHGGNEIIMEGEAGKQQIRIHSPTDNSQIILGNCTTMNMDDHWFVNAGGNAIQKIDGMFDKTVKGDVLDFFGGAMHRTIIGFTSTFIGGVKNEVVVGAENKVIKGAEIKRTSGAKVEVIKGASFKHDNSKQYELVGGNKGNKAPSWLQQVKMARGIHDQVALNIKGDKLEKAGDKMMRKANTHIERGVKKQVFSNTLGEKIDGMVQAKYGQYKREVGGEMKAKAANIKETASKIKLNGLEIKS